MPIDATYVAGRPVDVDETNRLISSDKVDGTDVYSRNGDHLGTVHDVMIDKRTGQVEYAIMSFGGFLGIGESYHPLPWRTLTYDTSRGAMSSMSIARGSTLPRAIRRAACPTGPTAATGRGSTNTGSRRSDRPLHAIR
jgi:hypothetical protein